MDSLPDRFLVMLLQHLGFKELFACRVTCKRLHTLALDPTVWRHRCVGDKKTARWLRPVLRFTPCLAKLVYRGTPSRFPYDSTNCAVETLEMEIAGNVSIADVLLVAKTIRNQETLGRLKNLTLSATEDTHVVDSSQAVLLKTALTTSSLEKLELVGWPTEDAANMVFDCVVRVQMPPLKSFKCGLAEHTKPFINLILDKLGNTLEEVNVYSHMYVDERGTNLASKLSSPTVTLLAGMPNLRRLVCPAFVGMQVLAVCESLKDVSIDLRKEWYAGLPDVARFLRRATHLRSVFLWHIDPAGKPSSPGVDLVLALALSKKSEVEHLRVSNVFKMSGTYMPHLKPLLSALPMLRNLRSLWLEEVADEFLVAIKPTNAPALRILRLMGTFSSAMANTLCSHSWIHKKSAETLLSVNPALHVQLDPPPCESCKFCRLSCHKGLRLRRIAPWCDFVGLFSHPENHCPAPDVHTKSNIVWLKL